MASAFWEHALQSALPTIKVCMLGAVGVMLAKTVSGSKQLLCQASPTLVLAMPWHGGFHACGANAALSQRHIYARLLPVPFHAQKEFHTPAGSHCLQGILDPHGRKTLSKLIYFVFTPCLTFAKLAPVLTARTFVLWMPLAINMFFRCASNRHSHSW
eukprot:GHRQ01032948.1.p1 GENE.GHRQ01032948.1~~GHRQ01032948.1.p1  ORF type:complete len:157 (-),score=16.64 GHRQ01032948.1:86-556(-)